MINNREITRDMVVSCVYEYGKWIQDNAGNIVGEDIKTLPYGQAIKVSFEVDPTSVPVVKVERNHFCINALGCMVVDKKVSE